MKNKRCMYEPFDCSQNVAQYWPFCCMLLVAHGQDVFLELVAFPQNSFNVQVKQKKKNQINENAASLPLSQIIIWEEQTNHRMQLCYQTARDGEELPTWKKGSQGSWRTEPWGPQSMQLRCHVCTLHYLKTQHESRVTYPWTQTAEFCTVLTQDAEAVNVIKNAFVKINAILFWKWICIL